MYVTKLKKDGAIQADNIIIKILSTGEASARIAIFADNNKNPVIHKIDFDGERFKHVANL